MNIFKFREVLPQIPNLIFHDTFKFHFEKLPFEAQNISWVKKYNFFLAGINQFLLPNIPFGKPVIAQVEPANVCNLGCSLCLSATHNHSRVAALLPFNTFKKFIDEIGNSLLLIIFWSWGEPFLNPDSIKMIEYATSKGILVHTSTNGNIIFNDETADRIVKSNLTSLIFAVDGATQETYSKYRVDGSLERVKSNIRSIVAAKKRNKSQFPMVTVRFVAMQPNEQEMKDVENLGRELGADFFAIKSVDMPPVIGDNLDEKYRPEQDSLRRYEYEEGSFSRKEKPFVCMRPWKRITLDALGEVVSCEYDYKDSHSFGNIGKEKSVIKTWKSDASKKFRKMFNKGHNHYYHCLDCTYKNNQNEDCILDAYSLK